VADARCPGLGDRGREEAAVADARCPGLGDRGREEAAG